MINSINHQSKQHKNMSLFRMIFALVFCLGWLCAPKMALAQKQKQKEIVIKGTVTDPQGIPLQDVLVDLKESLTFTLTDQKGNFTITVPGGQSSLIFALDGFNTNTVSVGNEQNLNIKLLSRQGKEDQEIILMYGKQKESLITSAVSTVKGNELEGKPVMFQNAALTGLMPGVLTIQESGAPGQDNATLYLRGRRSWRNRNPLVFVDGHLRDFSLVDPHEIDQISAYKDAGALAVFGLRGGNGALMATTRRGKEGRPTLKFNSQLSFQQPTKMPDFLDSWHYAKLYNEAMINDDPNSTGRYTEEDLGLYLSGESPYTHPNVDWLKESLKEMTTAQKYNLSIEGGSSVARYFVNLSFLDNSGLYNVDKNINSYNTNANFQSYSVRSNVDISLTKDLDLAINLYGRQRIQNNPGGSTNSDAVFNTLYSIPSNMFPMNYGPGKVAGRNEFRSNPYGILNYSGYSKYIHSTMEASIEGKQKLDFITKGLRVRGSLAFDARFDNTITRSKSYLVYQYLGKDSTTNDNLFTTWGEEKKQSNTNAFGDRKIRIFDLEAGLDYARIFGRHNIAATLAYNNNQESDDTYRLTNYHQGLFGRATYAYNSRYIAEFSFGYQGTEQLPASNRYGFFPAVSAGWIASEESFIKEHGGKVISFLKLRGSCGLSGNDDGLPYFYYLPTFKSNGSRYNLGVTGANVTGWVEDGLFNENVTWEESLKLNLGADTRFFKDKLSLSFDYFNEKTTQILTTRTSVSTLLGLGAGAGPLGNVGESLNKGFEIETSFSDSFRKFHWTVGGNISYAYNEIIFNDEQSYQYNYRKTAGHPIGSQFGYETNGLYIDEQDLLNSPKTTFGPSYAGDIKYRDLNGDGIIDIQDQDKIGESNLADFCYSFFVGANYLGFDFNALFSGVADRNYYLTGVGIQAFTNISGTGGPFDGNVQQYHWNNRYNPEDPSSWAAAKYPRLSLQGRSHNAQTSSFWMEDGTFLRLKTLEFGYTLPQRLTKKFWLSKVRIFYSGYNLLTWDKMRTIDPESSPNANNYPVQKISSFGLNIHF